MMTFSLWSPVRVLDGSFKARHNAERALRDAVVRRYEDRLAVTKIERQTARVLDAGLRRVDVDELPTEAPVPGRLPLLSSG